MLNQDQTASLPFATRDQLDFQQGQVFGIRVTAQADSANPFYIKGATRSGTFTYRVSSTNDSAPSITDFELSDIPIWITVLDADGNYFMGELYVAVTLLAAGDPVMQLCAGYVYLQHAISWPMANIEPATPLVGFLELETISNPAAGDEFSIGPSANQMWRVHGLAFQLVASAGAANRIVHVEFAQQSTPIWELISGTTQTANQTRNYRCGGIGTTATFASGTSILLALPQPFLMDELCVLRSSTENIQTGDQYAGIYVLAERFTKDVT